MRAGDGAWHGSRPRGRLPTPRGNTVGVPHCGTISNPLIMRRNRRATVRFRLVAIRAVSSRRAGDTLGHERSYPVAAHRTRSQLLPPCIGMRQVYDPDRSSGRSGQFVQHERWGNRRRRAQRFGAAAANDAGGRAVASEGSGAKHRAKRCGSGCRGRGTQRRQRAKRYLGSQSGAGCASSAARSAREDGGAALLSVGRNGPRRRPEAGRTTRPAMRCGQARHTGMPSWRARSTRFSVMPEPGKAITPFGSRFSSSSLRRNGAARPWRVQSGLQTT